MRSYSEDLRKRIVGMREGGRSAAEIAALCQLSKRSVERYWKQQTSTGSVKAKRRGGYRRSRLEGHDETLRKWIKERADTTLEELRERIADELGVHLGVAALWYRLDHLGLSFKKNPARRRAGSS